MNNCDELPKFFIVPSKIVASQIKKEHKRWINSENAKATETKMRNFRIAVHDPDGYMNNWKAFGKPSKKPT